MRIKAKWHKKGKERSLEELASALAFTTWRIGMQGVLHLENEGFQTDTQSQRMDVVAEFAAFLTHIVDRYAYSRMSGEERARFINAFALKMAEFMQDNRQDVAGPGDHAGAFVALLNARTDDYAECSFDDREGPGFSMRRTFGDHVTAVMGEKDRRWITDYVMDVETPEALRNLKRALRSLMGWEELVD